MLLESLTSCCKNKAAHLIISKKRKACWGWGWRSRKMWSTDERMCGCWAGLAQFNQKNFCIFLYIWANIYDAFQLLMFHKNLDCICELIFYFIHTILCYPSQTG